MQHKELNPSKNLVPFGLGAIGKIAGTLLRVPALYATSYGMFEGSIINWLFETVAPNFSQNHPQIKRIAVATSVVGLEAFRMLLSGGVYNPFTSRIVWTLIGALAGTYIKDIV